MTGRKHEGMQVIWLGPYTNNPVTGGERRISAIIKYLVNEGIKVRSVDFTSGARNALSRNFLFINFRYLLWLIRERRRNDLNDIVMVEDYSQRFYFFIFNCLARLFFKTKLVGLANAFYFAYRSSYVKNYIDTFVSWLFLRPLDLLVVGGKAALNEVRRLGASAARSRVIYPALRREFVEALEKPYPAEHEKSHSNHLINLLTVGRLHPVKGLEYLLEALSIVDDHKVKLAIVGDTTRNPNYTKKLFNLAKKLGLSNRVDFVGEVGNVYSLIQLYKEADIFILPSVWETSPHALMEAMCIGLPIIASNVGGISELIENEITGILVPHKDSKALAQAITKLSKDPDRAPNLAKAAYQKSFHFRTKTWEDVGNEYYGALLDLVHSKHGI